MRYELKYAVNMLDEAAIKASIMMHPASFTKAYEDRQINNIYLDTPDFHCYHQNVEGQQRRKKMRLRWYGAHQYPTSDCVLEIKNKNAELGWKESYKIKNSHIHSEAELLEVIQNIGPIQSRIIPTLYNVYQRSYYISQDGLFRLTVDTQPSFMIPFADMPALPTTHYPIVVELKYEQEDAHRSHEITDYLAFRQTKNSKYTIGVTDLYF